MAGKKHFGAVDDRVHGSHRPTSFQSQPSVRRTMIVASRPAARHKAALVRAARMPGSSASAKRDRAPTPESTGKLAMPPCPVSLSLQHLTPPYMPAVLAADL